VEGREQRRGRRGSWRRVEEKEKAEEVERRQRRRWKRGGGEGEEERAEERVGICLAGLLFITCASSGRVLGKKFTFIHAEDEANVAAGGCAC
jgi:hypothetical protein